MVCVLHHRSCLLIAIPALLQIASGHFFWSETNHPEGDHVTVTFSEKAGVPDPVIAVVADRVSSVTHTCCCGTYEAALALNGDGVALEGDLIPPPDSNIDTDCPAFVSGSLDYGPFAKFDDLRYSFGAQVYRSEANYRNFFLPLLQKATQPTVMMPNCLEDPNSFRVQVGGFPPRLRCDVCIYLKGGLQVGCTSVVTDDGVSGSNITAIIVESPLAEQQDNSVLYALANLTFTDPASGDTSIMFASTSVYNHGQCQG